MKLSPLFKNINTTVKSVKSARLSMTTLTASALVAVLALSSCGGSSGKEKDDDGDGVVNSKDAFPNDKLEWSNNDGDEVGDNADLDDDNDGISDLIEIDLDFDPLDASDTPLDTDKDGSPDVQDTDDDNDGVTDTIEVDLGFDPLDENDTPLDTDMDGSPDVQDTDDDNDGISDVIEVDLGFDPLDDTNTPEDTDGDGYPNVQDAFADDATEWLDTDMDGTGNNADLDDDNDRYTDLDEDANNADPLDDKDFPTNDNDQDFISDMTDDDDDNDGVLDVDDAFALLVGESVDTDSDGIGDNSDYYPSDDACWSDSDGDGACDQTQSAITEIELSNIQGHNGFVLNGETAGDQLGYRVKFIGDINHDGFDDYALQANAFALSDTITRVGKTYVFFGSKDKHPASLDFSIDTPLDGSNGFEITGTQKDQEMGEKIEAIKDINGDGIDDFLIGHKLAPDGSYVIFGQSNDYAWPAAFDLSALDGSNGFALLNIGSEDADGLGDINGDGFNDLGVAFRGDILLAFGGTDDWAASYDFDDPTVAETLGTVIEDAHRIDAMGDINGDGIVDFSMTNRINDTVYIVFGKESLELDTVDLTMLDGTNGFQMEADGLNDIGLSMASADLNDDQFSDIVIGFNHVNTALVGRVHVLFGSDQPFASSIDLETVDGTDGVILTAGAAGDYTGYEVSVGDINADGVDDIITSAPLFDFTGRDDAGQAYVIYGQNQSWSASIDLSSLTANQGFAFNGELSVEYAGVAVSSGGDINGDGIDDLLIGALGGDLDMKDDAGKAYVWYGYKHDIPTMP